LTNSGRIFFSKNSKSTAAVSAAAVSFAAQRIDAKTTTADTLLFGAPRSHNGRSGLSVRGLRFSIPSIHKQNAA
jgi:hypothetical protein